MEHRRIARCAGRTFQGDAHFHRTTFQGDSWFSEATFQGKARFEWATFQGEARFDWATFTSGNGGKAVVGARVLHLGDPDLNKHRVWPDGCTIRPNPADPTRGTLIQGTQAEEPEPAAPPPDPTG